MTQNLPPQVLSLIASVDTGSIAYRLGSVSAFVVLAILTCTFARRLIRSAPAIVDVVAFPTPYTPTAAPANSTAPPGFVAAVSSPSRPVAAVPPSSSSGGSRTGSWIGLAVCLMLLAGGIVRTVNMHNRYDGLPAGFHSQTGIDIRAGFKDSCAKDHPELASFCGCSFARITALPQYDTVAGFAALAVPMQTFVRTHDLHDVPPAALNAMLSCRALATARPSA